jgi:hypothetical protein
MTLDDFCKLPDGAVIQVQRPITHPKPDRRSKGRWSQATIEPGPRLIVRRFKDGMGSVEYTRMALRPVRGHSEIGQFALWDTEKGEGREASIKARCPLLLPTIEACEPTTATMMSVAQRSGLDCEWLLGTLVATGIVTVEQVQVAAGRLLHDGEDDTPLNRAVREQMELVG